MIICKYTKTVYKEFKINNLSDYRNLYVQSNTSLLAEVFENFRNKCIAIYKLDPADFSSAPGLAWQACLKKTEVKLELLTDIGMLLMVEKGTRGGIFRSIHKHAKANNKYMKNYNKNKESSYLMYLDANDICDGSEMSQKLPVGVFKWKKEIHKFNKDFIKNCNEGSNKGYILEVDLEYSKNLLDLHVDLPFLAERKKLKKSNKLVFDINDKENYVVHIRALKQALSHGLILKKVHRVSQFNQ